MEKNPQTEKTMKLMRIMICLVISLVLLSVNVSGQEPDSAQDFVLLFSNNVHGELEPCG